MSVATAQRPTHVSFAPPSDSLRQSTLKKNMSITQTYYLAHKARGKLSREAAQADHDLRLLVGHANLLDSLMLELADAEREQERWFNQSVRGANTKKEERHVQWADNIAEVPEEDGEESDYDYDSESSDDDYEGDDITMTPVPSIPSKPGAAAAPFQIQTPEIHDGYAMEDDLEEDYAQLELVRTPSHSNSPPELVDESDSSDDESMPPSPAEAVLPMPSGKDAKSEQPSLYDEDYLTRQTPAPDMVAAISVY